MNFHLIACFLAAVFITNCDGLPANGLLSTIASRYMKSAKELIGRDASDKRSYISGLLGNITSPFDEAAEYQITQQVSNVFAGNKSLTDAKPGLEALGLVAKTDSGSGAGINGFNNSNPNPPVSIFPQRASGDAPYGNTENALRGAIFIPSTFQTNKSKTPILMCPGTGAFGGQTYEDNMFKLFSASDSPLDPVVLNVPGYLVGDAQSNSEFVAYGINYLTATTNKNIAVMTWSQGSLNVQWAMTYWPSTRKGVTDIIAISPDLKGSVLEPILCNPIIPGCGAAVRQQASDSNFIKTLRGAGGDSAYVPVTAIYGATDEIVQPQFGSGASGIFNDARNVGVTNNEIQDICGDQISLHESVLYNNLAYNLALDAVTHDGPGQTSRLDLNTVCASKAITQLSVLDVLGSEEVILTAAVNILTQPSVSEEPPIRSYAQAAPVTSGGLSQAATVSSAGARKFGFNWIEALALSISLMYFLISF